jgi:hypothetical protein
MAVAAVMIAHQVAAKAVRDAAFTSASLKGALPAMTIVTAALVVVAVPVYARLLARFSPRRVVPAGFLLSAAGHAIEWQLWGLGNWVIVLVYLHVAGFGALLLSGFWSFTSELFDPKSARSSYARIAAAGALGGLASGLALYPVTGVLSDQSPLLFLAVLHVACAGGLLAMGRIAPGGTPAPADNPEATGVFTFNTLGRSPHLKTLAFMILLGTAGAVVAELLWKFEVAELFPEAASEPGRRRYFAIFYSVVQVVTVLLQTGVGASVRRLGLGRTIAVLPGGLGVMGALALIHPTFRVFTFLRGTESVFRGSFFRGGYELIFVPMDPEEKRRTKTFLDVTCDRAGDAVGAVLFYALWLTAGEFWKLELLAVIIALAAGGLYLARRLDVLYLGVLERRLIKHGDPTPVVFGSEAGWTVVDLPVRQTADQPAPPPRPADKSLAPSRQDDPRLRSLADLRSGDRRRVEAALGRLVSPDALQIGQVIQLLAWDDVVPSARKVLEVHAAAHIGQMVDALLDERTDFAIRRRLPRILGTTSSERALFGLTRGLDDSRFEVRYQCARAIDRIIARGDGLAVEERRLLAAVERELSVTPQVWHGHQLIDRVDRDDAKDESDAPGARAQRNLEHVFTLLTAVLPREPLQVAFRGIQSDDAGLRSLAVEYLDGVLPTGIRTKLWALVDPELAPDRARVAPDRALEALRQSAQRPGLK